MDNLKHSTQEWLDAYELDKIPKVKTTITILTRDRVGSLERLLTSISKRTFDLSHIAVIVTHDDDDPASARYLAGQVFPFPVTIRSVPRSDWHGQDYWNPMAEIAAKDSDVIWILCDDTEIITDGWDAILCNVLSQRGDRKAWYIGVEDSTPLPGGFNSIKSPPYSTMPMLTREAYLAAGFFMWPSIATWGNDLALYIMWAQECLNRTIAIPEIVIAHHCQHNHTTGQDNLNKRVEQLHIRNIHEVMRVMNAECPIHAERIAKILKERGE